MNSNKSICIHASNVAGLGSITVVSNILLSFTKNNQFSNSKVFLFLPKIEYWESIIQKFDSNWEIKLIHRSKYKFLRLIERANDVLFGHKYLPDVDVLLVLGDFPLKFKKKQILLFHNVNLISSNSNFNFYFHKLFFKLNLDYINKCIVQTDIVKLDMISKFPLLVNKINILPMPVDEIFENNFSNKVKIAKLDCFYPASFYAHKNHKIIIDLCNNDENKLINYHFYFTIDEQQFFNLKLKNKLFITNLGQLTKKDVYDKYLEVDVLIFPSLLESYGIPLIEAMKMNLYIICADLPYAKWLCENEAEYFNPMDPNSLLKALDKTFNNKMNNIKPNWHKVLSKIPKNWDVYSLNILN